MTEHDTDPSLEQKIKQQYRALSTEQPPAFLDRQIMAAAHRAVAETKPVAASGRNTWLHSLAYAAVLVLAISVIIEVSLQPEVLQTEPSSLIEERSAPAARVLPDVENAESGVSRSRSDEIEPLSRKQMQKTKKAETRARQVLPSRASEPAQAPLADEVQRYEMAVPAAELMMQDEARIQPPPQKPWRSDPESWLQHCQQLLVENNIDDLTTELVAFKQQHAQYALPKNLSDWLQASSLSPQNP